LLLPTPRSTLFPYTTLFRSRCNRDLMMEQIVGAVRACGEVRPFVGELKAINCHHNYVARERHYNQNILVTRKGAVRARQGDMGIDRKSTRLNSSHVKISYAV